VTEATGQAFSAEQEGERTGLQRAVFAAPTVAPSLDAAAGVLALQRVAGNRRTTIELRLQRLAGGQASRTLSRCAGDTCHCGGRCQSEPRSDELDVLERRGAQALSRAVVARRVSLRTPLALQRTLGDGHDLTSPRFSLIDQLESAYDGERSLKKGDRGRGVQAIQQSLYDLGFRLPRFGADGDYGDETVHAVKAFQRANPPLVEDGEVGKRTMTALDAKFPTFTLPTTTERAAAWTPACVERIVCPWSHHTIEVLRTRITLKSFDSISWADEKWDGSGWVPAPFPGGGYNTGTEIGVLNSSCEKMAETLYHEVLHAEQPTSQRTTLAKESYAYRIGEEFSIAAGLGGRASLRSTGAHGREFADPTKVGTFVRTHYPSVPVSGASEEIIGKGATLGEVRVQRANGTIYTRPAAVGERVPGPMTTVNAVTHPAAVWTCP
jgi:hypothetical protein